MPALNGKMECGRMTCRQELYHPLMCAPTNGDRLSLPQEASTPLNPKPSNTAYTLYHPGECWIWISCCWPVGWRLDLDLAKEGNKSREQLRCGPVLSQPRHGRRVQLGPSLVVFKTFGFFSGLSLLRKIT